MRLLVVLLVLTLTPVAAGQAHWTPIGPYGGYFNAIVPVGDVLFAGYTPYRVVYRSINNGAAWQRLPIAVSVIAPYPHDPQRILAAGESVYRSTDAGATWTLTASAAFRPTSAQHLRFHPRNPAIAYVDDQRNIYRTTDAGDTWQLLNTAPADIVDLRVDPNNGAVIYFLLQQDQNGELRISRDGGRTLELLATLPARSVNNLLIDAARPQTMYVSSSNNILRSNDSGIHWARTSCACHNRAVVQDPGRPNVLYALGSVLKRTSDRGGHWTSLPAPQFARALAVVAPDSNFLVVASDNGMFLSDDGGAAWRRSNKGLRELTVSSVVAVGDNHHDLFAAAGGAAYRTTDGGGNWTELPELQSVEWIQEHPQTKGLLFAGEEGTLFVSVDGGINWSMSGWSPGFNVALDPRNTQVLYSEIDATYRIAGIARSTDRGKTWTTINNGLTDQNVGEIAVSPWNDRIVLAATGTKLFRTNTAGAQWREVMSDACCDPSSIRFDPRHTGVAWAVWTLGLYKSVDSGMTWSNVLEFAPTASQRLSFIEFDRLKPNRIYAGGVSVLIVSEDGGASWQPFVSRGLMGVGGNQLLSLPDRPMLATVHGLYQLLSH